MNIEQIISQVMELDSVKRASSWDLEKIVSLSFEVAVIVKKNSSLTKQQNLDCLIEIVKKVLDKEEISSLAQEKSTFDLLKSQVDIVLPVVFANVPHLNVPMLKFFLTCCSGSSVVEQVEKTQPVEECKKA